MDTVIAGQTVIMSNGGHTSLSHGIGVIYDRGALKVRFRRRDGREWRYSYSHVTPSRWYHVVITWYQHHSISTYLNG